MIASTKENPSNFNYKRDNLPLPGARMAPLSPRSCGGLVQAQGIAVDEAGNVYVTGRLAPTPSRLRPPGLSGYARFLLCDKWKMLTDLV